MQAVREFTWTVWSNQQPRLAVFNELAAFRRGWTYHRQPGSACLQGGPLAAHAAVDYPCAAPRGSLLVTVVRPFHDPRSPAAPHAAPRNMDPIPLLLEYAQGTSNKNGPAPNNHKLGRRRLPVRNCRP
jgi:hypothetical protein